MDMEMGENTTLDAVIVGAGAAGIGMGVALQQLDLDGSRFTILERHNIGESFKRWPAEMRFISPSFNSNAFGLVDLNAITPNTSPAYNLRREHPSGMDYARYLQAVANHFELPIRTGVDVRSIQQSRDGFEIEALQGRFRARFVIWAAGEFQYPRLNGFRGAELCLHSSKVRSWSELEGKEFVVIGGYESGVDAAVALSSLGRRVRVLDTNAAWKNDDSDPSLSLSPYTTERLKAALKDGRIELCGEKHVIEVERVRKGFAIRTDDGEWSITPNQPILAAGFNSSAKLIADLFEWRDDDTPKLNGVDESTVAPGLFLVGPNVRHDKYIFCFIYKFRQRFAVVANAIGERMALDTSGLQVYRASSMYLDDLSCCGVECDC